MNPIVEPKNYVAIYHYSIVSNIILVIFSIGMIILGIYFFFVSKLILSLLSIAGGLFTFFVEYKNLININPKLKLANEGLWTKELGFKYWNEIRKIEIIKTKSIKAPQIYLEVYLTNRNADFPNLRLNLSDIKNYENIEPMINKLNINQNLKKKSYR
ncbi:MAG: hypothetical protein ABWY22_14775 [Flavobacterium sp.]